MWPALIFFGAVLLVLLQHFWQRRRHLKQQAAARQEYTSAALQQQQEIYAQVQAQQEALFDSMAEGVLVLDPQGKVQVVNRSLRANFKFPAEIRGLTVAEAFTSPELLSVVEQLQAHRSISDFELVLPGEKKCWLEVNASVVVDRDGVEQGKVFVFHNLTKIRELETLRREFVANVSHELRTPLSLIKGFVETLLNGAKDDPATTERFLQKIDKNSNRLFFLIEDLLTISCLESGQILLNLQSVNLKDLTRQVLEDMASVIAQNQVVVLNEIQNKTAVWADPARLQQVIFNLVENALKYGKKGGHLTIGELESASEKVEIFVRDDGPGIPAENRERIFERFYRVDRARARETGGTGLGLSIVKHIVQAHGGEVRVESELNQGSTFFFTIAKAT